MYPQVVSPKRVTEKWLKQAFAPLTDYLQREFPEEADRMLSCMEFFENKDQRYYYRNRWSKGSIVLDQTGNIVVCDKDALQYDFGYVSKPKKEAVAQPCHPNVQQWMVKRLKQKQLLKHGSDISRFLQEYWGPLVNYQFETLEVGFTRLGAKVPYTMYLYQADFSKKVAMQFVGDEIIECRCSYKEMSKFKETERALMRAGWQVITVYRELFDEDSQEIHKMLENQIRLAQAW